MRNTYYVIPVKDRNIIQYNKLVEDDVTLINNGIEFVCKTFLWVVDDELMSNYQAYTHAEVRAYILKNDSDATTGK